MSAKFIAALFILALTFQTSPAASLISRRSAIQNQCLQENAQDHKAYLACIREKKAEQKSSNTAPVNATSADSSAATPNSEPKRNQ